MGIVPKLSSIFYFQKYSDVKFKNIFFPVLKIPKTILMIVCLARRVTTIMSRRSVEVLESFKLSVTVMEVR